MYLRLRCWGRIATRSCSSDIATRPPRVVNYWRAKPGEPFEFREIDWVEPVRAKIHQFDLSGHADRDELIGLAKKLSPKTIFLHHGDSDSREWFSSALSPLGAKIIDPEPLVTYET